MKDKAIRQEIVDLEKMFRSLSNNPRYKGANLFFLRADVARDDIAKVAQDYNVKVFPTVQVFIGRQQIQGARIQGFVSRDQINRLIKTYLKSKIDTYLQEKDKALERELEQAKIRAYNRPYIYGPYGLYPYGYGYPYGWYNFYGPRYGFYYGW